MYADNAHRIRSKPKAGTASVSADADQYLKRPKMVQVDAPVLCAKPSTACNNVRLHLLADMPSVLALITEFRLVT
jgi:hypothetical protein